MVLGGGQHGGHAQTKEDEGLWDFHLKNKQYRETMYSSWLFLLQTAKLGPVLSGPEIIPHKSTIDDVHLRLLQRKQRVL